VWEESFTLYLNSQMVIMEFNGPIPFLYMIKV